MALTIKQLSADSSFLLSFEPVATNESDRHAILTPFRILLDPRIQESSPVSPTFQREPPSRASPPEDITEPDIVIVSHASVDHCDKAALRQLPRCSSKTMILAEPRAARKIRSWKYFDKGMVRTLHPWQDPRTSGRDTVVRVSTPPLSLGGEPGEVTIAFVTNHGRCTAKHSAVGITYRPPPSQPWKGLINIGKNMSSPKPPSSTLLPPRLPKPRSVSVGLSLPGLTLTTSALPTPPDTPTPPRSLRSRQSAASLSPYNRDRSISVIFSPHGIPYADGLEPYATSHLVNEAALPLTALLHCFNSVSGPRWLPRTADAVDALGMPAGLPTVSTLGARAWISTHDDEKPMRGLMRALVRSRNYSPDDIQERLGRIEASSGRRPSKQPVDQTEIIALATGDQVMLTNEGICEPEMDAFTSETPENTGVKIPEWSEYKLGNVLSEAAAEPLTLLIQRDAGTE